MKKRCDLMKEPTIRPGNHCQDYFKCNTRIIIIPMIGPGHVLALLSCQDIIRPEAFYANLQVSNLISNANLRVSDLISNATLRVFILISNANLRVSNLISNANLRVSDLISNANLRVSNLISNANLRVSNLISNANLSFLI